MNKRNRNIWFPVKKYGWGWGLPIAWQGWVVLTIYIVLLAYGVFGLMNKSLPIPYLLYFVIITMLLIIICYLKGEKPGWHWGKKE